MSADSTDDATPPTERPTRERRVHEQLHALLRLMDAQTDALAALAAAYARDPAARDGHPYLAGWFPSRIAAFADQRAKIARAVVDAAYRRDWPFGNVLGWYQSLGQAFDVDLAWSGREDEVFARNGDMHRTALAVDRMLDAERP
jgi:hypothetical protein